MPTLVSATTAAAAAKSGGVVFGGGPLVKDSRWLTLEVCREFARNKCTRLDDECRFAHPPSNVEIQNGRVMCCFDSIKVGLIRCFQNTLSLSVSFSFGSTTLFRNRNRKLQISKAPLKSQA